jgi:hypothetical protein
MLYLDSFEILDRILKKVGARQWCLLRFDDGAAFDPRSSATTPDALLRTLDHAQRRGFEVVGGSTDRGRDKLVDVYDKVRGWLEKKRERVGFKNLYDVFLARREPPSGLLILNPNCLVFVPGVRDPRDQLIIKLTGVPKSKKEMMERTCAKHQLKYIGDPDHPILYRADAVSAESLEKFVSAILAFFEEVGYANI